MTSDDSDAACQVTSTSEGVAKTLERLDPWLDDGNLVLVVQGKGFRVHRTILGSYSEIFKDMFTIPHSDANEVDLVDGCPVVHLQDAVDDVQIMLRAFYDRSFVFFYNTPMPYAVLLAFLRMGKKYAIPQLLEEGKRRLSLGVRASNLRTLAAGDISLFPRISGIDRFNFMIANLASENGLFSTLVSVVFYICLVCPASVIANGYGADGERITLSASSMRYCLMGMHYLLTVEKEMTEVLASSPSGVGLHHQFSCVPAVFSIVRAFSQLKSPFAVWVPSWDIGLCNTCRAEMRKKHEETSTKLWKNLPVVLGLGSWEDLEKDSEMGGRPVAS